MCVDFRTLNKITTRDHFPPPLIEDQLDLLGGKKYFTILDLKDGFFHVKMHEESVKYTSFVTPFGQYEYVRMPFGLKGAPLKFQRYVTQIFKDQINAGDISVYLDDFLIAMETIEHHFRVLRRVFELLIANRLELRLDKCRFLQTKLDYLGYTIKDEGIRPTDRGLEVVKNFPIPRSVRDVQSFLGLCSYFRKFIEHFSIIAEPLYDVTRKNVDFQFGKTEGQALKGRGVKRSSNEFSYFKHLFSAKRNQTALRCERGWFWRDPITKEIGSEAASNLLLFKKNDRCRVEIS